MRRHISARRTILLAAALGLAAAGCSSSSTGTASGTGSTPATSSSGSASAATVSTSSCGTKPGVAATGTPIPLGAIATNQPGTSFTDIPNMAKAYFDCVNANGGINGHPIKLYIATEQTNPAQIAADAKQLVQTDKVVGIVGSTSLIECSINSGYWQKLGFYVIDSGIAPECYSTPNSAAVNMGPRYSSDGAVQYALAQHVSKVVFDQANVPGTGYIAAGPAALAKAANTPIVQLTENVPITDASSVAIKEVNDAGPNGAVILNFTPPQALVILQAAQKLGLENRVKLWGCSTPCNTDFLAQSLGAKWNGKLFVNAELTPPDGTNTTAMNLYKAILKQYGSSVQGGIGSFRGRHRQLQPDGLHRGRDRGARAAVDHRALHGAERQRRVQGGEGLQHRHVVPAVDLRRLPAAHPEQQRLHGHAEGRPDDHGPGLYADLRGRPADREVPQRGGHGGQRAGLMTWSPMTRELGSLCHPGWTSSRLS